MRTGSFSRTVWRRDGAKYFSTERGEILFGLSPEEMCAGLKGEEGADFLWTEASAFGWSGQTGYYAVLKAAGDLAARGADPVGVSVRMMLPSACSEDDVAKLARGIGAACSQMKLQAACFQGETSPAVHLPTVCISAAGTVPKGGIRRCSFMRPGQAILLCGYTGLEGTLRLLDEAGNELGTRFVPAFLDKTAQLKKELVTPEMILRALRADRITPGEGPGISAVQQIGSGGILGALWDLTEASGTGMHVEMPQMAVRQETVEICEFYRINPYLLTSAGSFLIAADDADRTVDVLEKVGVRAGKLGVATAEHAKVVSGRDEIRYLDRPAPDELIRWWAERLKQ